VRIVNNNYRVAGFWARLLAYALDLVCIYIISSIAVSIISSISKIPQNYLVWMKKNTFMLGAVGFAYFTIMTRYWGQTIGKMICGIMVIRQDGKDIDWTTAFVREVAGRTVSQFFGSYMGYLIVPFVKEKRSCHDLLCDTYVVHVDELESKRWININTKSDKDVIDEFGIEHKEGTEVMHSLEKHTEEATDMTGENKEEITSEDN
jgi:uncharacterized RDD family membrane protein YckC